MPGQIQIASSEKLLSFLEYKLRKHGLPFIALEGAVKRLVAVFFAPTQDCGDFTVRDSGTLWR